MKIYGDSNSGNCLKVKWVCDKLALPYDWIAVDTIEARDPHRPVSQTQQRGAGAHDRLRGRPHAGAVQRHHPISGAGSDLIPADDFAAAKMDEWLFWEQYSHEPYVAVCRFQMLYLGNRPPISIRTRSSAATRRWRGWSSSSRSTRFLVGDAISLADISLLAYTRAGA